MFIPICPICPNSSSCNLGRTEQSSQAEARYSESSTFTAARSNDIHVASTLSLNVLPLLMTLLSLTPTFAQGFFLGQISILVLLVLVLRYLFFDTAGDNRAGYTAVVPPKWDGVIQHEKTAREEPDVAWLNMIFRMVSPNE